MGSFGATISLGGGLYSAIFTAMTSGSCLLGATLNGNALTLPSNPAAISIVPASAISSLVWGTVPTLSYAVSSSNPMSAFSLRLLDGSGNLITSNSSAVVSLSVVSGSGTLSGTTSVTAVTGMASFTQVTATTADSVTINATENSLGHAVS